MKCPRCGTDATRVGEFWICPTHGQLKELKPVTTLRLFLSYGHDANEELVARIKLDLEKRGHDVWFDKSEIKFGDDWRRSITEGITASQKFIAFLSRHSTRDPGVCLDEIGIAIGVKGGNIQTILVESEQEVEPPPGLTVTQWLDMHDWKERRAAGEAAWQIWYQDKFAQIVEVVESDETRRFAGEVETLEKHLKPIKSDSRIYELLKKGLTGRQWLLKEVDNWRRTDRASRVFWLMGAPGVGKSAVAAHLAIHGREVIAVEFCNWQQPAHRSPEQIVRTLAFQVATRLPDYRKFLLALPELAELDRKNAAELFDYLLADPLRHAIDGGRDRSLIVIDALDEAGDAGHNPLAEMLARDGPRLPDWIGIVVTSRPEANVMAPLQALHLVPFESSSEKNLADIRGYLFHELAIQLQARGNAAGLVDQIVEKSEGVFLYVEHFCDEIRRGHLSLDRPEQFPRGLGGIYFQYLQRQFPDLDQFRKDVRPALRAILAAPQPLPLEILQRLLNWQDEELRDFTRILGSLFPVIKDSNGEVVKPYHKSLLDWLADETKAGPYYVSLLEGHRMLANQLQHLVGASGGAVASAGGPLPPQLALSERSRVGELTPMEREYALSHLAFHLYAAHRLSELEGLVRKSWLDVQTAYGRGKNAFLRDVSFAIQSGMATASSPEIASSLVRVWRGAYASSCVRDTTGWYPPRVVALLAQARLTAQAFAFAELVPDAFLRCLCFCSVAEAAAQERNGRTIAEAVRRAFDAATAVTPIVPRAQGLAKVAIRALEAYEERVLEAAIDALSHSETGHWMGPVLSDLSDAAAKAARPDLLRRLLAITGRFPRDDFNSNNTVVEALTSISMAMGRLRMSAGMSEILSEALAMPDDTYHRGRLLTALIDAFAVAEDLPAVTSIFDTVVAGASREVRVSASVQAASAYHDLGQQLKAESLLDALRSEVEDDTPEESERDARLSKFAWAWSRIGRYDRATDAAESIRKPQRRSDALRSVGRNALAANDLAQAREAAVQSLEAARSVDAEDLDAMYLVVEPFVNSAAFLWDAGLRTEAIAALHEMLEIPEGLCDPTYGPAALETVLRMFATAHDDSGFQRAVAIASDLQDSTFRHQAESKAVEELSKTGDIEGAIALAERLGNESVAAIAKAALAGGHREKAIGLLEQVLRETDSLDFDYSEAVVHSRVAHELTLRGANREAEQVVSVALSALKAVGATSFSEDLGANGSKAVLIAQVALTLSRLGQAERSVETALCAWEEANPRVRRVRSSIDPETWRVMVDMYGRQEEVIKLVARTLTRAGQPEVAPTLARDAQGPAVLLSACEGIAHELLAARTVPPSRVSGLVRSWVEAAGFPPDRVAAVRKHLGTFLKESGGREQAEEEALRFDDPESLDDRTAPQAGGQAAAEAHGGSDPRQYAGQSDRELAKALARKAISLRRLGRLPESLVTWEQVWVVTKDLERRLLLEMLSAAAPALADLDGGKSLFQIHEAMQEVSGWWRSAPNIHAA